jgi:hypothetical protein
MPWRIFLRGISASKVRRAYAPRARDCYRDEKCEFETGPHHLVYRENERISRNFVKLGRAGHTEILTVICVNL